MNGKVYQGNAMVKKWTAEWLQRQRIVKQSVAKVGRGRVRQGLVRLCKGNV
ncbi:MAG: hypothetical protein J7M03_06840 [Candidatus Desulfofervidaceae bacterium]|nr:hypothetical protein [Candidatus Desulfofervidaceae bacterium]